MFSFKPIKENNLRRRSSKAVFGCRKTYSRKYIFPGNANFRKRKIFPRVWLHFKKFSGKYFLMFGKEEGKDKPKKNIINDRDLAGAISRSTARARVGAISRSTRREIAPLIAISVEGKIAQLIAILPSTEIEIAIDASRDRAINHDLGRRRDCDQLRDLTTARSREGEIAIDASRDHAIDRDLHNDRRTGAREIGAAWSSESAGDRRTDWNVSSPLARVRSLSLSLSFSGNALK